MRSRASYRLGLVLATFVVCCVVLTASAHAARINVPAGDHIRIAVAAAAAGDVLVLESGVHDGPVVIDRALSLEGKPGAIIDGHGQGSTIKITAPNVSVSHLSIRNSGRSLAQMDAGVFLSQVATDAVVEDNELTDNLVGVWVHGASRAIVRANRITGWAARNLTAGCGFLTAVEFG